MFGLIKEKVIKLNTIKDFILVSEKIKKDDKDKILTIKNRKILYKMPDKEKLKKKELLHIPRIFMDKLSDFLNNL